MREEWCDIDPNELVFLFRGFYVCADFGEIDQKCNRERAHRRTHRLTDTNRFYNLSHVIAIGQIKRTIKKENDENKK